MEKVINFLVCIVSILFMGVIIMLFYDKHIFFAIIAILAFLINLPVAINHFHEVIDFIKHLKKC